MFQSDRSFFIDTTDSSATEQSDRFQVQISNPITADNSFNEIYIALQSFTITNTLYNVLDADVLTLYVVYNDSSYPSKTPFVTGYSIKLPDGYYTAQDLVSAWNTSITTTGSSLNKVQLDHKNYTTSFVINTSIAPKLGYNSLTGKLYFDWSTQTEYQIPKSQLNDNVNYPYNPAPSGVFWQLNSTSYYMLYRLGLYVESDTLTTYSLSSGAFGSGVFQSIQFTHVSSGSNMKFSLVSTKTEMPHVFVENSVGYVDLLCEQIEPDQYTSTVKINSPTQTLMRIPILARFQQVQQIYYDNLVWCRLNENSMSTIQFSLRNPFTQERILKCPMLIQIVVHEEVIDLQELGQPAEQQRFAPPITFSGKRRIDQIGNPQQGMTTTQRAYNQMSYRV